jgi:hypothetical protein
MAQRVETAVDAGAAVLLGGALLFATSKLGLPLLLAAGWAMLAFLLCFWLLRSLDPKHSGYLIGDFAVATFQPDPPELLLDDAAAGGDSRVVRLFDPSASPRAAPPDASQALYDALAKLRRSLR